MGGGAAVTVMIAAADLVESATEVAAMLTGPEGACAGAVYVTAAPERVEVAEREPQFAALQLEPERDQVTPLFCVSLSTEAVKACV